MSDTTAEFFHSLDGRGPEPVIGKGHGTVRFELSSGTHTDRWLVGLDKGMLTVSKKREAADCTVRAEKRLFEGIVDGSVNLMAAVLRGALTIEGDPAPLFLLQRLFPGPVTKGAA